MIKLGSALVEFKAVLINGDGLIEPAAVGQFHPEIINHPDAGGGVSQGLLIETEIVDPVALTQIRAYRQRDNQDRQRRNEGRMLEPTPQRRQDKRPEKHQREV